MNKSARIISDEQYISAFEKQSVFPFQYYTAFPPNKLDTAKPFPATCPEYPGGCRQFNVSGAVIDAYNSKIVAGSGGWTRTAPSASTELYGGAFRARGDGPLLHTNTLSNLLTPETGFTKHCNKRLSEVTYDTWSCITVELKRKPSSRSAAVSIRVWDCNISVLADVRRRRAYCLLSVYIYTPRFLFSSL